MPSPRRASTGCWRPGSRTSFAGARRCLREPRRDAQPGSRYRSPRRRSRRDRASGRWNSHTRACLRLKIDQQGNIDSVRVVQRAARVGGRDESRALPRQETRRMLAYCAEPLNRHTRPAEAQAAMRRCDLGPAPLIPSRSRQSRPVECRPSRPAAPRRARSDLDLHAIHPSSIPMSGPKM